MLKDAKMKLTSPPSLWRLRRAARLGLLTTALTALSACATSDPSDLNNVADQSTDTRDMRQPDLSVPPDLGPDLVQDQGKDLNPCGLCCPDDKMCTPEGKLATCLPDGSAYQESSCDDGFECAQGQCVVKKVCEPGQTSCFDERTQLVCRPNGSGFATNPCPNDTACVQGQCTSGQSNSSTCTAHADCAGGKCHCGTQDNEGCAKPRFERAYCTAPCTSQADCSDTEWCLSADVHKITSQVANYNHCVPRCQGSCAIAGLACRGVGVLDESSQLKWEQACYFPTTKEIGQECTSDEECLGGTCLKDYFQTGYCSRRCEQGGCPSNAACVELKPNERWCTLRCGDGNTAGQDKCPLDLPTDRLDVTCKILPVLGGGAARVCTKT